MIPYGTVSLVMPSDFFSVSISDGYRHRKCAQRNTHPTGFRSALLRRPGGLRGRRHKYKRSHNSTRSPLKGQRAGAA